MFISIIINIISQP